MEDDNIFKFEDVEEGVRSPHLVPWLVTGLIAVVAILLAIVVLNISRGAIDAGPEEAPPVVEEPEDNSSESETPEPETPTPPVEPEPEPETPATDNPDDAVDTSGVVVGEVHVLEVEWGWDITTEVSNKLMSWTYVLPDGEHLQLDSDLINSLPASCAAQKTSWGLEKTPEGKIVAWSPQQMCDENPALYTELLGLVRHMADTVKPLN